MGSEQSATPLSELERLERENCLIKLEYPYHPRRRPWDPATSRIFKLIDAGRERYSALLHSFAGLAPFLRRISADGDPGSDLAPRWVSGWFPVIDGVSLYGLIARRNPRWYVEVGSGNSTMFARRAIVDHGLQTAIISIDPFPRAGIDSICDRIIRQPFEEVPSDFFGTLCADDILFVDNSHRSFPNSDVTVFFTEILPNLPSGIIYGLHDIFIPWDYPDEWSDRFYNEQYLLTCYLLGGANGDEIILPNTFLSYFDPQLLTPLSKILSSPKLKNVDKTGSAFWMRRA